HRSHHHPHLHSFPTRRSSDLVDLIIVRENTEDLYAGIEYEQGTEDVKELIAWIKSKGGKLRHEDAGISIKPISITGTRKIFEFADRKSTRLNSSHDQISYAVF